MLSGYNIDNWFILYVKDIFGNIKHVNVISKETLTKKTSTYHSRLN